MLSRPESLPPRLEARGVGLIPVPVMKGGVPLRLVIDMDHVETDRLPREKTRVFLGHKVPLLHKVEQEYFPMAIWAYLDGCRDD